MPNLIQIIKQAAIEAVEASSPTKVITGTVVDSSPQIKLDQKLTITSDFIIKTERLAEMGLTAGDKVILLQVQGGQQFIVLDKVGG